MGEENMADTTSGATPTATATPPAVSGAPGPGAPNAAADSGSAVQAPTVAPREDQTEQPQVDGQLGEQQPDSMDNLPEHGGPNWASRVYHGVLDALGGANTVQMQRDPHTGQMVVTAAKAGPGQQWKKIISGAITGAGAYLQNAGTGPGSMARGVGASISAGNNMAKEQNDRQRSQANEDFEAQQKAAYENARTALLNHQVSESSFNLQRSQIAAQFDDAARENQLATAVRDGGEGSQDLGVAKTFADVLAMHKEMPNLVHEQAAGNIIGVPHVNAEGKLDGMHYVMVTPEWKSAKLSQDETFYKLTPPAKPGEAPHLEPYTVRAGTMSNGDFWTARMASEKEILDHYDKEQKNRIEQDRNKAEGAKDYSEANKNNAETRILNATGELPGRAGAGGNAEYWGPGGEKGFNSWHDKNVTPAGQTETSYRIAATAYNEWKQAKAQGRELPTGAQSMQMLSQHMATTFGSVKGSRITKDMIEQHLGARSVSDSLQVAVQKLVNGDALSDSQWNAFGELISNKRNEQWKQVLQDAVATGRPLDRIAFPADFRQQNGLAPGRTLQSGGQQPQALPQEAITALQGAGGKPVKFANGQTWQMVNGQAKQIQ